MFLRIGKRRLCYDLPGDGPYAVRFVHALAADSGMWAEQVPVILARGMRVLRVDLRGHGGSDPVAGNCTLTELASNIARLIRALAMEPVEYVGLSVRGMIGALAIEFGFAR